MTYVAVSGNQVHINEGYIPLYQRGQFFLMFLFCHVFATPWPTCDIHDLRVNILLNIIKSQVLKVPVLNLLDDTLKKQNSQFQSAYLWPALSSPPHP